MQLERMFIVQNARSHAGGAQMNDNDKARINLSDEPMDLHVLITEIDLSDATVRWSREEAPE